MLRLTAALKRTIIFYKSFSFYALFATPLMKKRRKTMYFEEILEYLVIGTFFGLGWSLSLLLNEVIKQVLKTIANKLK